MVSLELRETLIPEDKTGSDTKTADRIVDLESGTIHEFDKPAPGMRLLQRNSKYCCIYRVPNSIRRVNPEAYTPQLIIIGPLHHSLKSQALKFRGDITKTKLMDYLSMEQHKKFYLTEFARRLEGEQTIDGLRKIIEEDEEMIRASYSESTVWIESPQFIDMILHDSVFIMEFILRTPEKFGIKILMEEASHNGASTGEDSIEGDFIGGPLMGEACHGGASHGGDSIGGDSFKGPLMGETSHGVADSIGGPLVSEAFHGGAFLRGDSIGKLLTHEISHGGASHRGDSIGRELMGEPLMDEPCLSHTIRDDLSLLENQLPYVILEKLFDGIVSKLLLGGTFRDLIIAFFTEDGTKIGDNSKFRHFTDLIRLSHVETLPDVYLRSYDKNLEHMYTADKLYSGGLKFEAIKENLSLNVKFENGCLKLPCLKVVDRMEMVFRNIMALEQCHYFENAYVCNYVNFLDYLIDAHRDVELLVEKGIIQNWIGQDSLVAEMVNKLCLGILLHGSHYCDIANEVNTYYENPINKSRAILKRVYFGNLWTGTATLAAMFLLVMTLIQTVASIIQIKK